MKQIQILIALSSIILFSCNFSKGVKKDLSTGLSSSYNGFAVEDIYLSVDGKKLSSNKVVLGNVVTIVATGVDNFKVKEGKVFPGCSILLIDKSGKEILNLADAFSEMKEGIESSKASTLNADLNTGNPMVSGETYHLKTRFYDKLKKENEIVSEVNLVMTE